MAQQGPDQQLPAMRLVVVESPFKGASPAEQQRNIEYARRAVADSLSRGEAPIASHLLYTQQGILNDKVAEQRRKGIPAHLAWLAVADAQVVYTDLGISSGMEKGIEQAKLMLVPTEYRSIGKL